MIITNEIKKSVTEGNEGACPMMEMIAKITAADFDESGEFDYEAAHTVLLCDLIFKLYLRSDYKAAMETIAICNQKGGVTKTTTTLNLGIGLVREGKRVLLVDADPQNDLTTELDERFGVKIEITASGLRPDFHANSRWSERYAAYACGLGTFGLLRGLITEKGMAGRFASIIVTETFEPDERKYTGVYDYCIKCGACARNCPANAISLKHGKNNIKCNKHVETMKKKYPPRYGCGKCQVGVPCEFRAPRMHNN